MKENTEMEHVSRWKNTEGCKVDKASLQAALKGTNAEYLLERLEEVNWDIGKAMDGQEIFMYWPESMISFLCACRDSMAGLSESKYENSICMRYMGNGNDERDDFRITFYKKEEYSRVDVEFLLRFHREDGSVIYSPKWMSSEFKGEKFNEPLTN